jgi:ADP-dependent NAD(P)H-hydrate dehydratase / NAD(P)H-hydrate epimerase
LSSSDRPTLSSQQVRELDRLAAARFGIALDWLMEAAGWQAARMCEGWTAVCCGVGNNAGDGLAAARHLHRWGRLASVSCVDRSRLHGHAARELEALEAAGVVVGDRPAFDGAQIVLDAIFGTGLNRAPEGAFAECIESINAAGLRVIAVDVPSGLDADTGVAYSPTVRADATITFTLPKTGLLRADGPRHAGAVTVADIGIPNEALAALGIGVRG